VAYVDVTVTTTLEVLAAQGDRVWAGSLAPYIGSAWTRLGNDGNTYRWFKASYPWVKVTAQEMLDVMVLNPDQATQGGYVIGALLATYVNSTFCTLSGGSIPSSTVIQQSGTSPTRTSYAFSALGVSGDSSVFALGHTEFNGSVYTGSVATPGGVVVTPGVGNPDHTVRVETAAASGSPSSADMVTLSADLEAVVGAVSQCAAFLEAIHDGLDG